MELRMPFQCNFCQQSFETGYLLKNHVYLHCTKKPFSCSICTKTFICQKGLNKHKVSYHSENLYKCDICAKVFKSKDGIRKHVITHMDKKATPDKIFKCDNCSKVYNNRSSWYCHTVSVHQPNSSFMQKKRQNAAMRRFVCEICAKSFSTNKDFIVHMHTHNDTDDRPHVCPVCTNAFKTLKNLRTHNLEQHTGRSFSCQLCPKIFTLKKSLTVHLRYIHKKEEKPFACKMCDFRCIANCLLVVHMRVHTGDLPFKCNICVKAYTEKNKLEQHKRQAHGMGLLCKLCNRAYSTQKNLDLHINNHHQEMGPFICDICGYSTKSKKNLLRHFQVHLRSHECDICKKKFPTNSVKISHMRSHTGEKPFKCPICSNTFALKRSISKHIKKTHK